MDYYSKYIKYKNKYILEKKRLLMKGGGNIEELEKEFKEKKNNIVNLFNGNLDNLKEEIERAENKLNIEISDNKIISIIKSFFLLPTVTTGIGSYWLFQNEDKIKEFAKIEEKIEHLKERRVFNMSSDYIINYKEYKLEEDLMDKLVEKNLINFWKKILMKTGLMSGTAALILARLIYNSRKIYNRANIDLKNLIKLKKEFIKYISKENKIKHIKILKAIIKKLKQKINMIMFPFFGGYTDYNNMTNEELNNMGIKLIDEIKDISIKYKNIINKFPWFKKVLNII